MPLSETLGALCKAKEGGLARHIGVSNFNTALLEEATALSTEPLVCNQFEMHPFLDQSKLAAACRAKGMAVVAYGPIARGNAKNDAVLARIGQEHGKTAAQVCLRYLVQQDVVVIPRTSKIERLEENLSIFDFTLTDAEMAEIASLARRERPDRRLVVLRDAEMGLMSRSARPRWCCSPAGRIRPSAWPGRSSALRAVETVGFDYGQRHRAELDVRPRIRERIKTLRPEWAARLGDDHMVKLDALAAISETALTRDVAIEMAQNGLPTTFVPGRNLAFFAFAGALAYRRGAKHLVAGMCETDFSGYPDCRDDTVKAMQVALTLGMDRRLVIHTPLMWIDKAATFAMAHEIGGDALVDLLVEETHTCYLGDRSRRHAWGYGCGTCPACRLRADGFAKWKAEC